MFKAGDVVACKDASGSNGGLVPGRLYVVKRHTTDWVELVDDTRPWADDRFCLYAAAGTHVADYMGKSQAPSKPPKPITEPPIHCAVCNLKAPMVESKHRMMPMVSALSPDKTGWMAIVFPWKEPQPGDIMKEIQWLCPADALKVKATIVHNQKPMMTEDDL